MRHCQVRSSRRRTTNEGEHKREAIHAPGYNRSNRMENPVQPQATSQDSPAHLTFATWVLALHAAGETCADKAIAATCAELMTGKGDASVLISAVAKRLSDGTQPNAVEAVATELYPQRTHTDLGQGDRATRLKAIRARQFGRPLPWLARIVERSPEGQVGPIWLLVQTVTSVVVTMDPNPWNDIDEAREIALTDFQVLWELDACTSVSVR